jgi:hypothetical protein
LRILCALCDKEENEAIKSVPKFIKILGALCT